MARFRSWIIFCILWLAAVAAAEIPGHFDDLVKKAESGDAVAQFQLGRIYEEGEGIAQDDQLAASWYKKSAEQGNAGAANSIGIMYSNGRGVAQDKEEAARWFLKATEGCDPSGAYNLAIAYYNGDGVVRDPGFAFVWLLVAKRCGNSGIQSALDHISSEITAEQRGDRRMEIRGVSRKES